MSFRKKKQEEKPEFKAAFSAVYLSYDNDKHVTDWYIYSGASRHMTLYENCLSEVKKSSITKIVAANDEKMSVTGSGKTTIRLNGKGIDVNNVLLVPKLSTNLLSVAQMVENGNSVVFDKTVCKVFNDKNELMAQTRPSSGVYKFDNEDISCIVVWDI